MPMESEWTHLFVFFLIWNDKDAINQEKNALILRAHLTATTWSIWNFYETRIEIWVSRCPEEQNKCIE